MVDAETEECALGAADADPPGRFDLLRSDARGVAHQHGLTLDQVDAIVTALDPDRLAQHRRPAGQSPQIIIAPSSLHRSNAPDRLQGSDQDGRSAPARLGDHVHADLGVNRIDIECTGLIEHRRVSRRPTATTMAGQISFRQIGFGLDNHAAHPLVPAAMDQELTQQFLGNVLGGAIVKRARQSGVE